MKQPFVVLVAGVVAFVAGCVPPDATPPKSTDTSKIDATGQDFVVLEIDEIEVIPGKDAKPVEAKSGTIVSAKSKDPTVTAVVKDGAVHVAATKDAKEGPQVVTVEGKDGKTAKLKVKVRKAE